MMKTRFATQVRSEVDALLSGVRRANGEPVREAELAALPDPVKRWLKRAGIVGRPRTHSVHLLQEGKMRLSAGGPWLPVAAEQYFDVDAPAFVWSVKTRLWHAVPIEGRDLFSQGHGHLLIRAAGLFTVADGRGEGIDQGTRLRFLGEIVWFPSAALKPFIHWEPLDDEHALATLALNGWRDEAIFSFDAAGRVTSIAAQRFNASLGRRVGWVIPIRAWRTFDGVEVPSQGDAVWKLAEGDLDYFRWRITQLELNPGHPARPLAAKPAAPD
jgi:hypothetical protein